MILGDEDRGGACLVVILALLSVVIGVGLMYIVGLIFGG